MKKILKYIFILFLFIFSIYYTDKSIEILKSKDPIMLEIKNNLEKYKIEPVNAIIKDNIITPGKNGKEVDIKKSYNKMKKYGSYNEALTTLKDTVPVISIISNKDKYIRLENSDNKKIALIFIIEKDTNFKNILNIIKKNKIKATFFINEDSIEDNIELLSNINHEVELFTKTNNKQMFTSNKSYLESLTQSNLKYCYTEEENNDLLNMCIKNKMYTVMPSLIIKKEIYKNIKNNIETSPIISIYSNKYIEKELSNTILYLKKKGYKFLELKDLINENN